MRNTITPVIERIIIDTSIKYLDLVLINKISIDIDSVLVNKINIDTPYLKTREFITPQNPFLK